MAIDVLYFAWIKEKVGVGQEHIALPASVETVSDLIDWLSEKSESHEVAFRDRDRIRAAVDQVHVGLDAPVTEAREVAFFPPVTGGCV